MRKGRKPQRSEAVGRRRGEALSLPTLTRPTGSEPPRVGFVSLGCVKNLVDSEIMLARIAESGALLCADESAADTMVVNTCGFLAAARAEAIEVLRELAERKRQGTLRRIVVVGCLVQRDGEKLLEAVPEIDALVGVNNREDLPRAVWGSHGGGGSSVTPRPRGLKPAALHQASSPPQPAAVPQGLGLYLGEYHPQPWNDRGRLRLTPRHYAYVRISEGCDRKCTFCTIPSIRGPLHCKMPDEIVAECRELIADGARELILIGQDTTSYGRDIGYEPGLAGLLHRLDAECDGARWLRLMYAYPSALTEGIIDAIADCERVVNYIDIPLQHINNRVLKAMGRRVTRGQTEMLLEKLRRRIPGVTIRTTFMVGFPGESEAEFEELLDFVHDFTFDAAGAFRFSQEPDTPAAGMAGQLDDAVKQERYERLMLTQQKVALAAARRRVGQTFEVVVDGDYEVGRTLTARHSGQAPEVDAVCLLPAAGLKPGQVLDVECVDTTGYDLVVQPAADV